MKNRFTIKIAGAAGQGIKSTGLILSSAIKKCNQYVFGYTEYPSLIRGGHNVFQIEISQKPINSISLKVDLLCALNKNAIKKHIAELEQNGLIIFDQNLSSYIDNSKEIKDKITKNKLNLISLDLIKTAKNIGGNDIMKNSVALGAIWKLLNQDISILNDLITKHYKNSKVIQKANIKCIKSGFTQITDLQKKLFIQKNIIFQKINNIKKSEKLLLNGNEAIALGAIASGMRFYVSYPMTPASSILTYLAKKGAQKGIVVKQAEDEISAVNMALGAMHAGTRAMCATSGGGFDLMTETISLSGITETPLVIILAQRPGPGTGVPTWTANGDLNLAIYSAHGEFPKIVVSISDAKDAFYLTSEAFNLAEKYQVPVILLTDKYIAESFFTIDLNQLDQNRLHIDRGQLLNTNKKASKLQKNTNLRYKITDSGISPRWLPGQGKAFLANSDEHDEKGNSTEDADVINKMFEKRMKKIQTIKNNIPDPEIFGNKNAQITFVTWGSPASIIKDAIEILKQQNIQANMINFTYLWPFKAKFTKDFLQKSQNFLLVENNFTAQLGNLIKLNTGIIINKQNMLLKYSGRPIYIEELIKKTKQILGIE